MRLLLHIFIFITVFSSLSFAWGGRGHYTICDVATNLVKNEDLKKFLTFRPHVMGHLCNIPDVYWKSLPSEITKDGNAAHFVDGENGVAGDFDLLVKSNVSGVVAGHQDDFGASLFGVGDVCSAFDAEFLGFVRGGDARGCVGHGGDDRHRLTSEFWVELLLDGREIAIEVKEHRPER